MRRSLAAGWAWLVGLGMVSAQDWVPVSQPLPLPSVDLGSVPLPPPTSYPPPVSTEPPSVGYSTMPQTALPLLEASPTAFTRQPLPTGEARPIGQRPVDLQPLPGSLEYSFEQELAARDLQRQLIWNGTTVQNFPNTLLWEPVYASKREARMMVQGTNFENYTNTRTLETSIGTTLGLWRITPPGHDWAFQVDLFGVVHSRLSPEDLIAVDYRFGVPLTFYWADLHGKIAYEHTSTHLGDEYQRNTGVLPFNFSKDEVVVGLGHYFFDRSLRIYGQVSYAFFQDLLNKPNPWRYDAGFQYVVPGWGSVGSPFVAAHADFQGVTAFNANVNLQAGWLWRNPCQRLSNVRAFVEYYKGRSPYGQFAFEREDFYGVGISCDF